MCVKNSCFKASGKVVTFYYLKPKHSCGFTGARIVDSAIITGAAQKFLLCVTIMMMTCTMPSEFIVHVNSIVHNYDVLE